MKENADKIKKRGFSWKTANRSVDSFSGVQFFEQIMGAL